MNLYFYVFIGVNVLSLFLCLYMVIKSLKFYKLDDYPFSVSVCVFYINKFEWWISKKWGKVGEGTFKSLFFIIYFLFQLFKKSSFLLNFLIVLLWFIGLFFIYCFISDFCILIIKIGRFIRDFYIYKKTKKIYGRFFYKININGKEKKCFYSNEFKNVSLVKCGIILVVFSLILIFVDYGFNLLVLKPSDYMKNIFKFIYGGSLFIAFVFFIIHYINKLLFFFKRKFFKARDKLLKTVSLYPSGNVREICFYKNKYLYWEKVFFDKKNRLFSCMYFDNNWNLDIYKFYFYSGNVAFEFFESNNSIVYYNDNPRKEIRAEAFFDKYRTLIYFMEYDFVKISYGKNVKNEIVYKDEKYIGWKYLKLKSDVYIKQDMSQEEVDSILQKFDLSSKKL